MTFRTLSRALLITATMLALIGCSSAPRPGSSLKADSLYRAQEQTFRPMAN